MRESGANFLSPASFLAVWPFFTQNPDSVGAWATVSTNLQQSLPPWQPMNSAKALFHSKHARISGNPTLRFVCLVFSQIPTLPAAALGCVSSPVTQLDQYPTVIAPPETSAIRAR